MQAGRHERIHHFQQSVTIMVSPPAITVLSDNHGYALARQNKLHSGSNGSSIASGGFGSIYVKLIAVILACVPIIFLQQSPYSLRIHLQVKNKPVAIKTTKPPTSQHTEATFKAANFFDEEDSDAATPTFFPTQAPTVGTKKKKSTKKGKRIL